MYTKSMERFIGTIWRVIFTQGQRCSIPILCICIKCSYDKYLKYLLEDILRYSNTIGILQITF